MRVAGRAVSVGSAGRVASGFVASGAITPSDSLTGLVALGATGARSGAGRDTATAD
jgi:hypothetical protein